MLKKIFIISAVVLVLLAGVIFVYNFAFKKPVMDTSVTPADKASSEGKTDDSSALKNGEKKTPSASITAVSDQPVFGATLSPDENFIYFFSAENGQLNQVDFSGKLEKVLSTEKFFGAVSASWNKLKNKTIIEKKDPSGKTAFLYFDLSSKKISSLKENTDSVSWSTMEDKIIYKFFDPKTKKRTLNISDPDGGNWRKIADTDYFGLRISQNPSTSEICYWPEPDAFSFSIAKSVLPSGEEQRDLIKDKFGADLLWSPDGKAAGVSYTDQKGGKKTDLALMNAQGGGFHSLAFPTFAKKCAWSNDSGSLYCAIPGNIPESAILPNDWQQGTIQTADTFWKIEADSGKKERLVDPDKIGGEYDAISPFLSGNGKFLFFTNKIDGKLYRIEF